MTLGPMRFSCWLRKAANTHSGYVILIGYPRQKWLLARAWILRYTYISCLVSLRKDLKFLTLLWHSFIDLRNSSSPPQSHADCRIFSMNQLRPCAFNTHLQCSLTKLRGVVLIVTIYFILHLTSFYFIVFLSHCICLILVSTHKHCMRIRHDKENYNSTYGIVQMRLLRQQPDLCKTIRYF